METCEIVKLSTRKREKDTRRYYLSLWEVKGVYPWRGEPQRDNGRGTARVTQVEDGGSSAMLFF